MKKMWLSVMYGIWCFLNNSFLFPLRFFSHPWDIANYVLLIKPIMFFLLEFSGHGAIAHDFSDIAQAGHVAKFHHGILNQVCHIGQFSHVPKVLQDKVGHVPEPFVHEIGDVAKICKECTN